MDPFAGPANVYANRPVTLEKAVFPGRFLVAFLHEIQGFRRSPDAPVNRPGF